MEKGGGLYGNKLDMDYVIGILIGGLVLLCIGSVVHDAGAYGEIRAFVQECQKAGGFTTDVKTGFVQHHISCSVASINRE